MIMLNEHLWSGIIRRSETGEARKEDDIDLLDINEFRDYLTRNYVLYPKLRYKNTAIVIDLYTGIDDSDYNYISFCYKMNSENSFIDIGTVYDDYIAINADIKIFLNRCTDEFKKKYNIELNKDFYNYQKIQFDINKLMKNTDCIHFLDDYIKMMGSRYCGISKKVKK
jgi:hypothetical protein